MEEKEKEKGREERKKGEKEKEKGREERKKEGKKGKRERRKRKKGEKKEKGRERRKKKGKTIWVQEDVGAPPRFFFFLLNNYQVIPFRGNPLSGQRNPLQGWWCHKTP